MLCVSTYAGRYSAYNPIEHLLSPVSNRLTGVAFPAKLQGESNPPCKQCLSAAEKKEKEFTLFNKALDGLEQAFSNVSFDGFPVSVNKIHCGEDNLLRTDIDQIRLYLKTSVRKLHEFSQLRVEFLKMFVHMDRHLNEITFIRCRDRSCCSEWRSEKLRNFLGKTNYRLPAPALKSKYLEGHYATFLEHSKSNFDTFGDEGQPTSTSKKLGSCDFCPSYNLSQKLKKRDILQCSTIERRSIQDTRSQMQGVPLLF